MHGQRRRAGGDAQAPHLPGSRTSFHGRTVEIADLEQWLQRARLITLVGTGGSGKTRLALEVAARVAPRFEDGVRLVDFASLIEDHLVPQAVAAAFRLQAPQPDAVLSQLADVLIGHRLLLILDNCEPVVGAVAAVANTLTLRCPKLTVIATSREPLGLGGEVVYAVPPLLIESEAVPLFIERAREANPTFSVDAGERDLIAAICRQLEGLPLAIELGAPWMRIMSPGELLRRLEKRLELVTADRRDLPTRQQTMRATVKWSYQLLSEQEQHLFRRLAAFTGSFTLDAAVAVGGWSPLQTDQVLDLLARLCDASMLTVSRSPSGTTRYRILETLREYGLEQLRHGDEETQLSRRHLDHYLGQAELMYDQRMASGSDAGFAELALDGDQMRSALKWALGNDPQSCLRLAGALEGFWMMQAVSEGREWMRLALARSPGRTHHRARALLSTPLIMKEPASWPEVRSLIEESLAISTELGDARGQAMAFLGLGNAAWYAGELTTARRHLEAALERHLEAGYAFGSARTRIHLGTVLTYLPGRLEAGRELLKQGLAGARQLQDRWGLVYALALLGLADLDSGQLRAATANLRAALESGLQGGVTATAMLGLGQLAIADSPGRALRLLGAAAAIRERTGVPHFPLLIERRLENALRAAKRRIKPQVGRQAWEEGHRMRIEEAIAYGLEAATHAEDEASAYLTGRQLEVAELIAAGLSNKEIAARLKVSVRTVEKHVDDSLGRLALHSRTQLAAWLQDATAGRPT